jgi:hypothetical protein
MRELPCKKLPRKFCRMKLYDTMGMNMEVQYYIIVILPYTSAMSLAGINPRKSK